MMFRRTAAGRIESMEFRIKLAGIPLEIKSIYREVYTLCADYLTDESPLFRVVTVKEDIDYDGSK